MAGKLLRAALEAPESEVIKVSKGKPYESSLSRGEMVKIKTELSDSVDCTICRARISVDMATDIYTKVSDCSHRVFASLISSIINIVLDSEDFSKFMCKHCFHVLLKIDETEQTYLRLKREFIDIYARTAADNGINYSELYKTTSTQTDDGTTQAFVYSEFCSVEVKSGAPSPVPSRSPSVHFTDLYDSDSEPLSRKKVGKKSRKIKKSRRIKNGSTSTFTCHDCNKSYKTKSLLAKHTLFDHVAADHLTVKNEFGHVENDKRTIEIDEIIDIQNIKQEISSDTIDNNGHLAMLNSKNVPLAELFNEDIMAVSVRRASSRRRFTKGLLDRETSENSADNVAKQGADDSSQDYVVRRKKREPKKQFHCPECLETFKTKAKLKCHMETHGTEKPPFICEICGASYKNKKACDIHVGMHKGISPWKCDQCGKLFPSKGALQRHEAIHTGKTNYQCDLCGKSFIHTSSFKMHKLSHSGVKPHACHVCGLSLMTKSHLKRHARAHSGEKRHECQTCGKKFSERYNLHAHQKSHDTGLQQKTRPKSFRCTVCDNAFERRYLLEKHMEVAHQRVMEKGPKKPRMTMSRLLKMQAATGSTATSGNSSSSSTAAPAVTSSLPVASSVTVKPPEVDIKPAEITVPEETFKSSPRDSPTASNDDPQTSTRVGSPVNSMPFRIGQSGSGSSQPGSWISQQAYHQLANDFPLRMHGLDYASYIGRQ